MVPLPVSRVRLLRVSHATAGGSRGAPLSTPAPVGYRVGYRGEDGNRRALSMEAQSREAQSREAHLEIGGKASGGVPRQCVLLAGGWGDPCGGAPQPPLTVADRPFLDPLIGEAVRFGIEHVVLLCGCQAGAIADHYREDRDHRPAGVELSIVVAPEAA